MPHSETALKALQTEIQQTYIKHVAIAYNQAYENASLKNSWLKLAEYIQQVCTPIFESIDVIYTADNPYQDFQSMKDDINKHHRLKIYTQNCQHPIWSEEENRLFRVFHDYYGHYCCNEAFTFQGELNVYKAHISSAPSEARIALMTELIGELCYYFYYKRYVSRHKICDLSHLDPTQFNI